MRPLLRPICFAIMLTAGSAILPGCKKAASTPAQTAQTAPAAGRTNPKLVGRWKPLEFKFQEKAKSADSLMTALEITEASVWKFDITQRGGEMFSPAYQATYQDDDRVDLVPTSNADNNPRLGGTAKVTGDGEFTLAIDSNTMPGKPPQYGPKIYLSFKR